MYIHNCVYVYIYIYTYYAYIYIYIYSTYDMCMFISLSLSIYTCLHFCPKCRDSIVVRVLGWDMKVPGSTPADVNHTG